MVNAEGIITTVAANGAAGVGGAATSAQLIAGGLAIDSAGNLYVVGGDPFDGTGGGVQVVNVSASALTFASAQIGSSSNQTVTVTNIGNAPLTFSAPVSGQNPNISAGFAHDSSSSCPQLSTGSQPATLASGASCTLVVDFLPSTTDGITGSASITDNALNTSLTQTVQLSAGAGETVATTTTLNVATPTFDSTAVSATILATAGTLVPRRIGSLHGRRSAPARGHGQ